MKENGSKKGDGGETKRKWEKERNQDSEKRQWGRQSCLEGSQTPVLQPENRPVWLSLLVLYSSTRPGRRFIVAITQIPLAFIPSLDASGLYSITVSIYRWKKSCTQEKCQGMKSPLLTNRSVAQNHLNRAQLLFLIFFFFLNSEPWSLKSCAHGESCPGGIAAFSHCWPCKCVNVPLCLMVNDTSALLYCDDAWCRCVCYSDIWSRGRKLSVPEERRFPLSPLCVSDHTVKEPGPWDPKSLDIRGLWDSASPPPTPHLFHHLCRTVFRPMVNDRCINYDHLLHQILEGKDSLDRRSLCFQLCMLHLCIHSSLIITFDWNKVLLLPWQSDRKVKEN